MYVLMFKYALCGQHIKHCIYTYIHSYTGVVLQLLQPQVRRLGRPAAKEEAIKTDFLPEFRRSEREALDSNISVQIQ